jgi:outer membrane protein OmpA-like peptidoglycan-associated protein
MTHNNRNMLRRLFAVIFIAGSITASAQSGTLIKANKLYQSKAYADAIPKYESVIERDSSQHEAIIRLADCYRLTNNSAQALKWYGKVVNLPSAQPIHKYYYGQMLMENGNYSEAQKYMSMYTADTRGENQLKAIATQATLLQYADCYNVQKLPTTVNSEKNDFSPVVYKNGLVFTSARDRGSWIARRHSWTDRNFYYLYFSEKKTDGYGTPSKFARKVKTKFNDGPVCFTADGKTMYFTRNQLNGRKVQRSKDGLVKLKICTATLSNDGNTYTNVAELPFNNSEYNCAHPAISADGQTLYFASDMSGGMGGMDIWMVKMEGGKWGTPVNLGAGINTAGNEVFPCMAANGMLYFSSDGLGGLGGLDLFEAKGSGSRWSVENMGAPLNSSGDDFGIAFTDAKHGYFSSNRGSLNLNDDIYSFEQIKDKSVPFNLSLADNKTGELLDGKFSLRDNESGEVITVDAVKGKATASLMPGRSYQIDGSADSYNPNSLTVKANPEQPDMQVRLDKVMELLLNVLVLNNPKDRQPVANATVTVIGNDGKAMEVKTGPDGRTVTTTELQGENVYGITANSNNKISDKNSLSTKGQTESKTYEQTLFIDNNGALCLYGVITDKSTGNSPAEGVTVMITDAATGAKLYETVTSSAGTYKTCNVEVGKTYRISVMKPGYFAKSEDVAIASTQKKDVEKNMEIDRIIVGKAIKIDNIYFDLSKWNIRPDAAKELDKIVKLMQENPDLVIELSSHTDCRSSAEFNMDLSDKRAKSSAQYIIDHGIDPKRITGKGYGETLLVNKCECEGARKVPCSEKEHQENRRTEFKVIGFIKDGVIYNPDGQPAQPK